MTFPRDPNADRRHTQEIPAVPQYHPGQHWQQDPDRGHRAKPKKSIFQRWQLWAGVAFAVIAGLVVGLSFADGGPSKLAGYAEPSVGEEFDAAIPTWTPEPYAPQPVEPEPEPEPEGPELNQRGNVVKQFGEPGGIYSYNDPDNSAVEWTVTDIDTDLNCTQQYHSDPAENGRLIGVELTLTTGPSFTTEISDYASISTYDFSYVDSSGITHTELGSFATYGCISDSAEFTRDTLGSGQKYVGTVVLDVPEDAGSLVFSPSWAYNPDTNGWEYPVG